MYTNLTLFTDQELPKSRRNLQKTDRLLRVFEDIHNHIYANDGLSSQQVFLEILKILFIKIFSEKNKEYSFYLTEQEFESLSHGKRSSDFSVRIKNLQKKAFAYFSDVIDESEEIKLKPSSLAYVVDKLKDINLSASSKDIKGLAFQKFVYSKQRGERGQFFTPEQIVNLCVQFIKPTKQDRILDPACGSAGFLSQAMKYVYENSLANASESNKKEFVEKHIFGIEINPMVAKVAKMRMILDGDGYSNIITTDALEDWDKLNEEFNKLPEKTIENCKNSFDVILTNPPFGSQGKVTNKSYLNRFDLAHKWVKGGDDFFKTKILHNGQAPDILFIERCLDLLKDGGRMAIVLPNGDLENSSLDYVREYIKKRAEVMAVVHLPFETFIPYGTGVKASLLFIKKHANNNSELKHNKVFFGKITKNGYLGNKNASPVYKKGPTGGKLTNNNGEFVLDEDVSDVVAAYKEFESNKETFSNKNCFAILQKELTSRFDLDFYSPNYKELEDWLKKNGAKSLGEVAKIVKRKAVISKNNNSKVNYVELADINTEYFEIRNTTEVSVHDLPSRATYLLKENDIITAVAGNSIGTKKHMTAIVDKEYDGNICTNGFRILRAEDIEPFYLLYYLRSDYFLKQVYKYRTGAAIPAISDEDLLNTLVYVPKLEEQRLIANKIQESLDFKEKAKKLISEINIQNQLIGSPV